MKIATNIIRRAFFSALTITLAAGGCAGTVRADGPVLTAQADEHGAAADDRAVERIEAQAVREAINQGKDYADAVAIGRSAAAAAARAAQNGAAEPSQKP